MIPKTNEEVYREAIKVGYEAGRKVGTQAEREKVMHLLEIITESNNFIINGEAMYAFDVFKWFKDRLRLLELEREEK